MSNDTPLVTIKDLCGKTPTDLRKLGLGVLSLAKIIVQLELKGKRLTELTTRSSQL